MSTKIGFGKSWVAWGHRTELRRGEAEEADARRPQGAAFRRPRGSPEIPDRAERARSAERLVGPAS